MADNIISEVELEMGISIEHLIDEFGKIRTGRANPSLVTGIQVEYYGVKTPLQQLASVSVPDPRLLVVQPFDKNSFEEIEKAIQNADIGLNPATDGDIIRIPIPALSEERRKELTKVASKAAEDTKVSIRSHRRTGIDQLSKLKDDLPADDLKRYEAQIQDLTDKFVQKIDELYKIKENELLEVSILFFFRGRRNILARWRRIFSSNRQNSTPVT